MNPIAAQADEAHLAARQGLHIHRAHLRVFAQAVGDHGPADQGDDGACARIVGAQDGRAIEGHAVQALGAFSGVGRRFQRYGDLAVAAEQGGGHFTLIDDYGHHPVEMAAVIEAARGAFPGRRLVLAFQPHRYTRTRDCFEDFVKVLGTADAVLLTEVYAAGEPPIVAADGRSLARALRVAGRVDPHFVDDVARLDEEIATVARDGDVVIAMGAGSIGAVPARVVARLAPAPGGRP